MANKELTANKELSPQTTSFNFLVGAQPEIESERIFNLLKQVFIYTKILLLNVKLLAGFINPFGSSVRSSVH